MDIMKIIVQWATILSPIIAVFLAWWTSRSGARDAAKMMKSVKELTKVQIEVTKVQLNKEIWEAKTRSDQASERKKMQDSFNIANHYVGGAFDSIRQRQVESQNLSDNLDFYSQQTEILQSCLEQLEILSNKVGG